MIKVDEFIGVVDEKRITWPIFHEIRKMVEDEYSVYIRVGDFGGWELVNSSGRITKRFRKKIKKRTGVKLDDDFVARLGAFIADNTADMGNYKVIFDSNCFTDGEFGDSNSCFQRGGMYEDHLEAWNSDNQCYTFKIYLNDHPFSRALAFINESGDVILTNSYGLPMRVVKRIFLRAFPQYAEIGDVNFDTDIYLNGNEVGFSERGVTHLCTSHWVYPEG